METQSKETAGESATNNEPHTLASVIEATARTAGLISYSARISDQILQVLEGTKKAPSLAERVAKMQKDPERFGQVHPQIKGFLSDISSGKREVIPHELESFLLALVGQPKPDAQKKLLDKNAALLDPAKAPISREHIRWGLQHLASSPDTQTDVLSYYACLTPEEKKYYAREIEEGLQYFEENHFWGWVFAFYKRLSPEEKSLYKGRIKEAVDGSKSNRGYRSQLFSFLGTLSREEREDIYPVSSTAHRDWIAVDNALEFFGNISSEERLEYKLIIDDLLERARKHKNAGALLEYYSLLTPAERQAYQEDIDKLLLLEDTGQQHRLVSYYSRITPDEREKMKPRIEKSLRRGDISNLEYYAHLTPEEKKERKKEIDELLRGAYLDGRSYLLLSYFASVTPEERPHDAEALQFTHRIRSQLTSEIGDVHLRKKYFYLLEKYLISPATSLVALQSLYIPQGRLALALILTDMGVDPLPVLSWQLTKEKYTDLLYLLISITGKTVSVLQKPHLFKDVPVPYRPRGKKGSRFEPMIMKWLEQISHLLDFSGVGVDVSKILSEHLEALRETSTSTTMAGVRRCLKEIKSLDERVVKEYQNYLGITGEITFGKFKSFMESWNNELSAVLVLAGRFKSSYEPGKKLVGEILGHVIAGTFTQHRYDCSDSLTRAQLAPLVDGTDDVERASILKDYHEGVAIITAHTREQSAPKKVSEDESFVFPEGVLENFRENLVDHGHIRQLVNLEAFKEITDEEKDELVNCIVSPLNPVASGVQFSPAHYEGRLPEEYVKACDALSRFFKDLYNAQLTRKELKSRLAQMLFKLPVDMKRLGVVADDIAVYLKGFIDDDERTHDTVENKEGGSAQTIYLTHTTDNPKTLFEIGKHPNSGSCQSYDYSTLGLVMSLPGYVADAHIQAIVTRELVMDEKPAKIISLDEGRELVLVELVSGETIEVKMSKPLTRAICMLGGSKEKARFVLQRDYGSLPLGLKKTRQLKKKALDIFIKELNDKHHLSLASAQPDEEIIIEGSHNEAGHYNDLKEGQEGKLGKNYTLKLDSSTRGQAGQVMRSAA